MVDANGLVKVEPLTHATEGVIEIFRSPIVDGELFDDSFIDILGWDNDADGSGLILYLFEGKRSWIKTSISKTPFAFIKKQVNGGDNDFLKHVVLIRGEEGYPLSDKEIKSLAGLLNTRLKYTPIQLITSYLAGSVEDNEMDDLLKRTLMDIEELLTVLGFDLTQRLPAESGLHSDAELTSGIEEVTINGLKVTVTSRLADENDPGLGVAYVSVKVVSPEGKPVLSVSSGEVPN